VTPANEKMPTRACPLFSLGQTVATPGALELLERLGVNGSDLLRRHQSGDWGDMCVDDKRYNEEALQDGSRIFSAYRVGRTDEKLWIITDAADDFGIRRVSTILRPEDY
jgi:hypothetical protein